MGQPGPVRGNGPRRRCHRRFQPGRVRPAPPAREARALTAMRTMPARPAPRTRRTWAAPVRRWPQRLRPHWVIIALLILAAALRVAVLLAYRPALIFPDSHRYLQFSQHFINGHWVPDTLRPSGYSILLVPVTRSHVLALAPIVQHLLGLAEGT